MRFRIGLIIDRQMGYCEEVLRGIWQFLAENDHWDLQAGDVRLEHVDNMRRWKADGVICGMYLPEVADAIAAMQLPVVDTFDWVMGSPFLRVSADNAAIGQLAAEHLLSLGLRSFAFAGILPLPFQAERYEGFCRALAASGCTCTVSPLEAVSLSVWGFLSDDPHIQHLRAWLRSLPRPCGIFASSDDVAFNVIRECSALGLRVPDDLAVIGVDNNEFLCSLSRPPLSSIALHAQQIGYAAATMLDSVLEGHTPLQRRAFVPPRHVVPRQSTDVLTIGDADLAYAIRFIRDHAHHDLNVDAVARAVAIPRRTLERKFATHRNCGVLEEIRRVRIERAKHLLDSTDADMNTVARRCGFSSAERFAKVFTQHVGAPPTSFRKRFRT